MYQHRLAHQKFMAECVGELKLIHTRELAISRANKLANFVTSSSVEVKIKMEIDKTSSEHFFFILSR